MHSCHCGSKKSGSMASSPLPSTSRAEDQSVSTRAHHSSNIGVIVENYREGDMVWVIDYYLILLPALLRSHPKTTLPHISFFLHVAFPSSEIFPCLSGVLGADLVGFQTANYARHFRQTASRILAYESLPKDIQVEGPVAPVSTGGEAEKEWSDSAEGRKGKEKGRFVDVGVFPMGIDVNSLREKKHQPEVQYWAQLLRQRYAGMKLIVGQDKPDETRGVRHKLEAFEHFLKANPEFQGKVVLIQVALQTTESNELAGGVSDVVARINAAFSTLTYQPVVFLHVQEVTFSQYLALLTVADAFMVTSLRECMALRTHEYVECQEERNKVLILSEFTGTYSYSGFRSCFAVNPYDTRGTAKAIYQAFTTSFLTRCLRAHNEHASLSTNPLLVPSLDLPRFIPKYRHSASRLIFVDLKGCLWVRDMSKCAMMEMFKSGKGPMVELPEATIRVLGSMADDPKNEIWVLSGLPVKGALERLAERVPRIGIVAEKGCFVKTREISNKFGGQSNGARWIDMVANLDFAWKGPCVKILNYFTERTPGSFVEERATSVVWCFWTGPPDSTAPINDDANTTTNKLCFPPMNTATSPSSDSHYSDRSWARRQAAEAQNHIFDSLGERYAVGTILHPGGPACSPLGGGAGVGDADYDGWWSSTTVGGGAGRTTSTTGGRSDEQRAGQEGNFILIVSLNAAGTTQGTLYFMLLFGTFRIARASWSAEALRAEALRVTHMFNTKMWLLDVRAVLDGEKGIQGVDAEIKVLKRLDDEGTSYAILSHRWGTEVDYGEITGLGTMEARKRNEVMNRDGYQKVIRSCKQAEKDGYSWLWIDTCCINKDSSAELSEAINSMYRWYRNAQRCYVYLSDVDTSAFPTEQDFSKFGKSNGWPEWFSRGWTLQELIAPKELEFFNKNWVSIGTKQGLTSTLEDITRIPSKVLRSGRVLGGSSVAQIMSWAADRTTTRVEDRAYSLLGLFDVNMPMLYGEGSKAFQRLQWEIIRVSSDHSIFAWNRRAQFGWFGSVLADDPSYFRGCHDIERVDDFDFVDSLGAYMRQDILGRTIDRVKLVFLRRRARSLPLSRWDVTNLGIQMTLSVLPDRDDPTIDCVDTSGQDPCSNTQNAITSHAIAKIGTGVIRVRSENVTTFRNSQSVLLTEATAETVHARTFAAAQKAESKYHEAKVQAAKACARAEACVLEEHTKSEGKPAEVKAQGEHVESGRQTVGELERHLVVCAREVGQLCIIKATDERERRVKIMELSREVSEG
ncbi:glycosyltransferase family 20-domain-containing protein [Pisolithus marmoratus]|nr:glycosyltransferase family 20-domain-containing protein [Pisolithus marmoratus]